MRKNRVKKTDWTKFLSGVPAGDYVFQNNSYEEQIERASAELREAEFILIGAGAGLSAAAGLTYSGKRFTDHFGEFIEKYGSAYMTDMYAAGFYPFPSQEAKWGYWSKHSMVNRFLPPALPLYRQLCETVKGKEYFVLTTNVDHQFQKAGFEAARMFATQGDYGEIQCERGCHQKVYDAGELFRRMDRARRDCLVPSGLVPKCPVCGGNMTMHLRCDQYFVEDEDWHEAAGHYRNFLERMEGKKGVLLELGVGFNTPGIIRFPFEKMARENENLSLIRLNRDEAVVPESFGDRAVGIGGDMAKVISDLHSRQDILSAEAPEKACGREEGSAMTHDEKRLYLIRGLLSEIPQYRDMEIPEHAMEQKRLLRSLMNIRSPRPIGKEFLRVQDEYLREEVEERGITDCNVLPVSAIDNRLVLWRGDITTLRTDAIVNAANSALRGCFVPCHSCVDNIIHSVSGIQLRLACDKMMTEQGYDEPTGKAKITPAFNLPCSYVIHTVGPIVSGALTEKHCGQLADCYRSCLELAADSGLKSIAFCCISTGEFHFPQERAAEIAVQTVTDFLRTDAGIEKVIFNVFKQEDYDIYKRLLG